MIEHQDRICRRCGCAKVCFWVGEDLCGECLGSRLPGKMTPAIAEVLGLSQEALAYTAGVLGIPTSAVDRLASVRWELLHLASVHGDAWKEFAVAQLKRARVRRGEL